MQNNGNYKKKRNSVAIIADACELFEILIKTKIFILNHAINKKIKKNMVFKSK